MKAIKNIVAVIALATVSFGTFAATTSAATEVQQSVSLSAGTVSATAATLDGLQANLSEKANAAGAKSFRIISATSGENQMRGVAELYN
ncbi:Multiple stress resistance protein BhsA [Dickeya dianthicola]|uniref:DUF1471 domain-containing protein n=1 Tax=Dickeya dianthicola TaxID=204039 RepID=A0AAP6RUU3_9GAMM|nr:MULTISPECIES: DUF1471 domain-containing protein [Dickeya]ATO35334.1 putative exported protein [Dickeya dianthicola RNS04.9]AYC21115.1 Multiple stress resistance protein BhsA [Dickeya dianthicola]MBI0439651.1 DUF1471 domain-containing protein [Dickeya dianthicola]MBI0450944.1 DUF1471 domain-containing protein [Dickeya dianthicola]MBI0455303.1 DUF1471 domain-containing protein [Dickeya dianthicola]